MNPSFSYRTNAVASASPVGLVVLLYEQLIEDLRRAADAMRAQDVQKRTRELDHGLCIIGQLQGSLDQERGGEAARYLDRYYSSLRSRLLQAQFQISAEILNEQIVVLLDLRQAWLELEQQTTPARSVPPNAFPSPTEVHPNNDWEG